MAETVTGCCGWVVQKGDCRTPTASAPPRLFHQSGRRRCQPLCKGTRCHAYLQLRALSGAPIPSALLLPDGDVAGWKLNAQDWATIMGYGPSRAALSIGYSTSTTNQKQNGNCWCGAAGGMCDHDQRSSPVLVVLVPELVQIRFCGQQTYEIIATQLYFYSM